MRKNSEKQGFCEWCYFWGSVVRDQCRQCREALLDWDPSKPRSLARKLCAEKLRKVYAKLLTIPVWTDDELHLVGPVARDDIRGACAARDQVRARIALVTLGYIEPGAEIPEDESEVRPTRVRTRRKGRK